MARIRMYSTTWCGYCVRAKALLERRGLEYEEIVMDDDPAFREKLLEMAKKARALGKPDAAQIVARRCMEIAR